MAPDYSDASAGEIAAAVARGDTTAAAVTEATLARIARLNPLLNAFTDVTAERARRRSMTRGLPDERSGRSPACPLR